MAIGHINNAPKLHAALGALAVCAQAKLEASATAPKANNFFISVFFMACISFCG
jgi:hypothetical protein